MTRRTFQIGDRVRVRAYLGHRRGSGVWIVAAEDTNRTPIHDREPAYQLRACCGTGIRYAYARDLELVEQ